jgi:two-component system response regulator NreC
MPKIRVLITDDHAVLRAGLRMLIDAQPDMQTVGEAADGEEAIRKAKELSPDVVVMDISMPGNGGLKAIDQVLEQSHSRILVLTMHEDPAYVRSVLAAGATGYVVKKAADSELISAIRAVHRGGIFIDSSNVDKSLFTKEVTNGNRKPAVGLLSDREVQVLQLLVEGYTNIEIANRIFVSVKSVETYRSRLTKKLGLQSRAELVHYALEIGLLNPDK